MNTPKNNQSTSSNSDQTTGRATTPETSQVDHEAAAASPQALANNWLSQQQWLQNIDVNQLSQHVKELSTKAVEKVNSLSKTQKIVGGALLVSGLSWLALRAKSSKGPRYYGSGAGLDGFGNGQDDTWQRSSESVYRGATSQQ